ncbi:DUF3823 domain-containing protein [Segetibacter sp. 3557_3]|uniref:DUF3823 domain-containing protein n=1 Tax=Segetibacter sp. 3557_3 TaxID=2547429 RepID=UPI0010586532|nr:DUF3823 domain-containing protein [Segetibacter sp. 3557_3]TDH29068.1 DUF3823 domain-containing protein [Segetibacter sp. 3557_3]
MKKKFVYLTASVVLTFLFLGCKKDNFKAPESTITGRIVYQGQPIGVRSNGVQLELWQYGYQLFNKVPVYIAQDGTFSIKIFDGSYKLTRLRTNGPWQDQTDSIDIQLNGSANIDVPVTPYYTVGDDTYAFNKADSTISGTFKINQVLTTRAIERISFHVSTTNIVDLTNQIAFASIDVAPPANALTAPVTLNLDIRPRMYTAPNQAQAKLLLEDILRKKYAFVRFGVKPVGVAERIYTTVKRIELP